MGEQKQTNLGVAVIKFTPILLLMVLIIKTGDAVISATISTLYAAIVAMVTERLSFKSLLDSAVDNVKEMQLVFFILMAAYAMAGAFMSTGVGASIINVSLNLGLTGRTIAVTAFFITSILSVATGTSWGTFAACAPVFLWLNHIVGGDIVLTTAAIAGGACFGDNIGLISDTTVVSSGIQKVEVIHRIKHQGIWSLLCLFVSGIIFYIVSVFKGLPTISGNATEAINSIPQDVWTVLGEKRASAVDLLNQVKDGVPFFMIIPLIIVIILAVRGYQTLICLGTGIISSMILGMFAGTVSDISSFLNLVGTGFADAGSWVIIMMMWVGAFGGIMAKMNAFDPLSKLVLFLSRNVRQLMFWNGILSIAGNALLADEMAQIVTIGPITKNLVDENIEGSEEDMYKLRLRNATFSDALGVFGSQLFPHHVYMLFYIGIASAVYPLYEFNVWEIITHNYMAIIAVSSILILTITGLDRFVPSFGLPSEPDVRLKSKTNKNEIIKSI
ncbi:Na+/H+ antiporter NhaC family protein [Oceanirhabdus seepicola]|uniref:Na+/H+ antiporter NhaC family protein n=1 Tax=Oceanirhabdus seepicola TaxID=2828781 RepID=A0A9J6NVV0_9CLOT|nr:Na+/H+ antiporter NhaC family protein [Oceanirhabdus seepicola]MCM1988387.1 Na+/H+ antiporter NhaC family protein [Oceanirhabdus seepicola]